MEGKVVYDWVWVSLNNSMHEEPEYGRR
jgi:hypothetical protein